MHSREKKRRGGKSGRGGRKRCVGRFDENGPRQEREGEEDENGGSV
jgi:hypothetical protein